VKREIKRKEIIERLENIDTKEAKDIQGVYDVIVIDPPWPMEKIERDERPNQSEFDYPTMTESELEELIIPTAEDCHVFFWTTHKFFPMAFRLIDKWRLKYVCLFTWHKPGGFQPFGLPQYNSEFAIYCRKGTPRFVDTKGFFTCFNAPRGHHSEKPGEFYDTIRRVTAGRRLDLFSRRKIEGFDAWGKEAK
jgi:N6-adenosine-specific RNA methylase IME4